MYEDGMSLCNSLVFYVNMVSEYGCVLWIQCLGNHN